MSASVVSPNNRMLAELTKAVDAVIVLDGQDIEVAAVVIREDKTTVALIRTPNRVLPKQRIVRRTAASGQAHEVVCQAEVEGVTVEWQAPANLRSVN